MTSPISYGDMQRSTVAREIRLDGVGLHSGVVSSVVLTPGSDGIRIADSATHFPVQAVSVARTPRCTRLELPSGRRIDMVEHLFAALRILGLTDVDIFFDGDEVPVLDGSSAPWIEAVINAGTVRLSGALECVVVKEDIVFELGQSLFRAAPGPFSVRCSIDFPNAHIGFQSVMVDSETLSSLSSARTFVMEHEIAALKANNLALGGSLDNAVVVGENGPLNPEGFRMPDECARHKALDFIGDLMVLGVPVIGSFEIHAPGHSANNAFVEAMLNAGVLRKVSFVSGDALSLAA